MNLSPVTGISIAFIIFLAALGYGALIDGKARKAEPEFLRLPVMFGAGAGILSLLVFAVCALRVLSVPAAGVIVGGGLVLLGVRLKSIRKFTPKSGINE